MKYSKRKIFKAVAVIVLVVLVFLSLSKFRNTTCKKLVVKVLDESEEVNFIDSDSLFKIIYSIHDKIEGHPLDSVNIYLIDRELRKCPYIRKASIYKTITSDVHIDVMQRRPILMVLDGNQNYYIDNDGIVFEAGKGNAFHCIVASGYVKDKYDFSGGKIYKAYDTSSRSQTRDLFKLAQLIYNDDFWRDQVEQIFINKLGEYEIVPMMGAQVLSLGTIEDYDKKMYTLKQFCFNALPKLGWNTYQQISVKYNNQVVCKRITK